MRVSTTGLEMDLRFQQAPIYRKHVEVKIDVVEPGTLVHTVLADGTRETEMVADEERRFLVTNPGGETYLISREKRDERYTRLLDNRWLARGRIRAFPNPFGTGVTIDAPWGSEQHGTGDAWFAATLDENDVATENRYLIGGAEMGSTYREETA